MRIGWLSLTLMLFTAGHFSLADDITCTPMFSPSLALVPIDYATIETCLTQITQLHLVNQPIIKLPPQLFEKMPALQTILVKNCNVTKLDATFFGDSAQVGVKLTSLNFVNNSIVEIDPTTFIKFASLTTLSLVGNKIEKLPEGIFIGLTKLQTLKLSHNSIREIAPNTFDGLFSLKTLDLQSNQLTEFSMDLLKAVKQPVRLALQNNLITTFTAGTKSNQIVYLDLQYNKITTIPSDFGKLTALGQLLLSHNPLELNQASFSKLPNALTQLFVSDVGLARWPSPLAMFSGLTNLIVLSIGQNSLTTLAGMPYLPKLNTMMLFENKFPDDMDLSTIKSNLPALEKVGLSQSEPAWTCAQVVRMMSQLEELGVRLYYKSNYKVFGIGNHVEHIGCLNDAKNLVVADLLSQVVDLKAQVKLLEGKLKEIGGMGTKLDKLSEDFEDFSICESFERCRGHLAKY